MYSQKSFHPILHVIHSPDILVVVLANISHILQSYSTKRRLCVIKTYFVYILILQTEQEKNSVMRKVFFRLRGNMWTIYTKLKPCFNCSCPSFKKSDESKPLSLLFIKRAIHSFKKSERTIHSFKKSKRTIHSFKKSDRTIRSFKKRERAIHYFLSKNERFTRKTKARIPALLFV